jgi:hypothetical protein
MLGVEGNKGTKGSYKERKEEGKIRRKKVEKRKKER